MTIYTPMKRWMKGVKLFLIEALENITFVLRIQLVVSLIWITKEQRWKLLDVFQ